MFDDKKERLLDALESAHAAYYASAIFSGPSLHFHLKALQSAREQDLERFAEHSYATLAAWGMHRMGPGGSKMREFEEFYNSLRLIWPTACQLGSKSGDDLDAADWQSLKEIFCGIRCMASGTSLVGNSKVMAHLLPDLVPPIDRMYTLTFLYGHGQISNGLVGEWDMLVRMLKEFFYPMAKSPRFLSQAAQWRLRREEFLWDTSTMKVIDNLVIGYLKLKND